MEFYNVNGVKVAVSVYGSGIPVLVLHGWGSSSDSWRSFAKDLSKNGYQVIVPDLPGFGKSEEPPVTWGLSEYSDVTKGLLKVLNIKHAIFVGHSFGGRISIEYSSRYQKDMKAVVLCGAAGIQRHRKRRAYFLRVLSKYGKLLFTLPVISKFRGMARKVVYKVIGARDYYVASATMRKVMGRVIDAPLKKYLEDINVPVLLLWGERDSVTPLSDAKIAHKLIPDSDLVTKKEGGHSLQREFPEFLSDNILEFINKKSIKV